MTKESVKVPGTSDVSAAVIKQDKVDVQNLDRTFINGMAWTAGIKWSSQIITWAATLVVARILTPEDYGLVAMATVFVGLIEMISDFGMGQAIVKHRELTTAQIEQINGLCVLLGISGLVVTLLAAYPMSRFFDAPALVAVVIVLAFNFLIISFRSVPLSLLQRDLEFRTLALNDGIQSLALSAAMVAFAALGFQYWSLVFGILLSGMLSALLAYRKRPTSLSWPRFSDLKEAITFGGHMIALRISYYVSTSADYFIAGKMLGQRALGGYSMAMTIARTPVEKVGGLLMSVLPPIISAVQNDDAALRRYILRISEGLALLTVPAAIGLALVAEDLIMLALGEKWRPAILPLQILSISIAHRSTFVIFPSVAAIIGLSKNTMKLSVMNAIILPVAYMAGSYWGIGGVAAVWILVYPFITIPFYQVVFKRLNMGTYDYLRALWPAVSCTALMAAVVYGLHVYLLSHWPVAVRLVTEIIAGAISYAIFLFAFHRSHIQGLKNVVRMLRSR